MSNNNSNVLIGALFDQLGSNHYCSSEAEMLLGSSCNPLAALRLLSIEWEEDGGMSFDADRLAKVCGVPVAWFAENAQINAHIDDVLKALGCMALV